ncbi:hypothetical protein TorRG33x02_241570 [Trema orientale]|uniref:Ulp1 protease family, C-terminal catalytic domain containing protein n=1 Tax=Trema orientale TaxID=63057 RepID=A0A2P5DUJ4_TREOI|nr:hypothetical protein TorRG33x02_241570 [Trema orientale]
MGVGNWFSTKVSLSLTFGFSFVSHVSHFSLVKAVTNEEATINQRKKEGNHKFCSNIILCMFFAYLFAKEEENRQYYRRGECSRSSRLSQVLCFEEVRKASPIVYAKLTDEEKTNYGDVVEVSGDPKREVRHGEGDLQPETDVMKERELHSRCSFDRLHKIYEFLTLEQKEAVRRAGFGSFLCRNIPYVSTSLIMWLVENIDPSRCTLTLNGKKYKLSGSSFENVMGIKDGGESSEASQDADDLFIARFALVAIGLVLCPPSGVHLSSSYLYAVSDTNNLGRKNWTSHTVHHLMESIRRYKVNHAKNLSGRTLYRQEGGLVDKTIPPIDFWDYQKCSRIMKWIRSVSEFTSLEVKLLNPGKEEPPLCPLEDAKKQKHLPMNYLKKHDEVASLRSLVVGFPEPVGQRNEKEAEKTKNALIVEVKRLVESVISHGFVRTKEDDNVMNVDEGENIVETSVGKIHKSSGAT